MRGTAFTILLALATAFMPTAARADIVGPASVIDGDTIEIHGQTIRLHGIDAPESDQTCVAESQWRCGQRAAFALDRKIGGREVTCAERDRNQDGLVVAVCRAGGEDLNAWLVYEGWALAYRKSSTEYVSEEQAARASRRGVWRGSILAPWDWRVSQQAKARANANKQPASARTLAELPPSRGNEAAPRTVTIHAAQNGHFHVNAMADGTGIQLVVDTGATWVSLSRRDAAHIGIDLNRLSFSKGVKTADGVARAAPITLRELRVGSIAFRDVQALVIDGRSELSLLGFSFLGRLQGYAVNGSTLTLTAN